MMLPRNLALRHINLVARRVRLVRNQSTEVNSTPTFVHPVSRLGNELNEQLKSSTGDSNAIYTSLKDELAQLSETMKDPTLLQRSFGLNGPLVSLLRKSTAEEGSAVDPYQILNTMCQFQVARSPHFEIVLRYLLQNGSPQEVIALWVKYLETIAENPNALIQSFRNRNGNNNSHENSIALTTLAYLSLPDNKPDLNILYQILQLDKDAGQQIPFSRVSFLNDSIFSSNPDMKKIIGERLDNMLYQYISTNKDSYLRKLDKTLQPYHLQDLYQQYRSVIQVNSSSNPEVSADPEILQKFMERFVSFNKPSQAVKVFNDFKTLNSSLLSDKLLLAVAGLPAPTRQLKMDRILAIWNSVIKPATPSASSYACLLEALGISGNFFQLQNMWSKEVPESFKQDSHLRESYLSSLLRYDDKVTFNNVSDKLPEKIESIELINAVLLKMIKGNAPAEKFESFYAHQFMKSDDAENKNFERRPNIETLAIKMWANYCYAKDASTFDFLKSISQTNRNLLKVNALIEQFIQIVPSTVPIRELYKQTKDPLDSRKYGNFIGAEFEKSDGSFEVAEEIFRDFLKGSKAQTKKIDRFVIEPLIAGFCEYSIRQHDISFLLKVSTYVAFASQVGSELTYVITAKILHTIAILSRETNGKFEKSALEFINPFLQSLLDVEDFNPNSRDLDLLRKSNVTVPKELS